MAMNFDGGGSFKNSLLSKLPADVIGKLSLHPVDLDVNLVLYEPNQPVEFIYFPETAAISVVALMQNGSSIEVGTIGREGMAGAFLLLRTDTVPYRYFIQVGGHGYRASAARFLNIVKDSDELQGAVLRCESAFRTQTMQGMACNGLHAVEQRCCRWLLMTRDRVDSDDLKLTHEFLGFMLGVRRSSVTDVLAPLQAAGMVRSNRGTITILDRAALEARVCECYWVMVERERRI
jgi:CRP-like cAMP-binding protein